MKLINNYKIDKLKQQYLNNRKYLFGIEKTANYEHDGSKINHLAGRIWNKLDYFKYFQNLTKQLPLIEFSNDQNNRTLIASIFENVIIENIKEEIYKFKEIGKFNPWFHKNHIEDLILSNKKYFPNQKEETFQTITEQGRLVYDCFMGKAYKELEKIKFRIHEYGSKEKKRALWKEKNWNSNSKSETQRTTSSNHYKNTNKQTKTLKMKCK